ncbi:MAG: hypothetical protein A2096_05425 [Spirochaetes bacterium GWF1_41_5]|nr:MAG: hypothetical protein A2096_05425 [Spirochaetes bacterium GWF1_41_5]HBE04682.1 hypothetical protein [Spirochaetia bacterium]
MLKFRQLFEVQMKIIDVNESYENDYFRCLSPWEEECPGESIEADRHKACWYQTMINKGLGAKIALNEENKPVGMIQYAPAGHFMLDGEDLYFLYCIYIPEKKKTNMFNRKKGIGKALLKAAEEDVKSRGAKALVVWGMIIPVFMQASWFKKQGYTKIIRDGISTVLWKKFSDNAKPPVLIKPKKKPELVQGKVTVTGLVSGWCSNFNRILERGKKAAGEFGDKVVYKEINTNEKSVFLEWGLSDALFIDDKDINSGPPQSYKRIKNIIAKKVKKLKNFLI